MAAAATAALLRSSSGRVLCSAVVCKPVTGSCVLTAQDRRVLAPEPVAREPQARRVTGLRRLGSLSLCLRLFPNGDTTESKCHIAVYLRLESNPPNGKPVSARAKFSVLDRHGPQHRVAQLQAMAQQGLQQVDRQGKIWRGPSTSWTTASPSSATPPLQLSETVVITWSSSLEVAIPVRRPK